MSRRIIVVNEPRSGVLQNEFRKKVVLFGGARAPVIDKVEEFHASLPKALNRFYATRKRHTSPEFLNRLKNDYHYSGDNIVLCVNYKGFPDPEVNWFKNQQLVSSTSHTLVNAGEGKTELAIFDAQKRDEGFYTCRIENDLAVKESSCQIIINDTKQASAVGRNYRLYRSVLYTPASRYFKTGFY